VVQFEVAERSTPGPRGPGKNYRKLCWTFFENQSEDLHPDCLQIPSVSSLPLWLEQPRGSTPAHIANFLGLDIMAAGINQCIWTSCRGPETSRHMSSSTAIATSTKEKSSVTHVEYGWKNTVKIKFRPFSIRANFFFGLRERDGTGSYTVFEWRQDTGFRTSDTKSIQIQIKSAASSCARRSHAGQQLCMYHTNVARGRLCSSHGEESSRTIAHQP